jgi:uncharacterized protein YejL (UPF0352 family)
MAEEAVSLTRHHRPSDLLLCYNAATNLLTQEIRQ